MLQNLISEIVYLIYEIKFSVIWQNQSPLPKGGTPDNPVRIVDAFVDRRGLKTFGFRHIQAKHKGAPSYQRGCDINYELRCLLL
jgi:hypothetical protein